MPNWMGDADLTAWDNASMQEAAGMIAASAKEYESVRDLQLVYMKEYEVLEGGIEVATYCNGTRIVGNFSEKPATFEGRTLEPFGCLELAGNKEG